MSEPRRLFVSHAHSDAPLVAEFVDRLLVGGLGLRTEDIFCSSAGGVGVPSGENLLSYVQAQVAADDLVIAIVSPTYQTRPVCLAELGAAWARAGRLLPFLVPGMTRQELGGILDGVAIFGLDDRSRLDEIYDRVGLEGGSVQRWNHAKDRWLEYVQQLPQAQPALHTNVALESRETVNDVLGSVMARLDRLQRDDLALISGTDCALLRGPLTAHVEAALARGAKIRVMCIDPELDDISLESVSQRDPRFGSTDVLRREIRETERVFGEMREPGQHGLELRFFDSVPALSFFIVESERSPGVFKVESFTPSRDLQDAARDQRLRAAGRPHWVVPPTEVRWRTALRDAWDFYWERARRAHGDQT